MGGWVGGREIDLHQKTGLSRVGLLYCPLSRSSGWVGGWVGGFTSNERPEPGGPMILSFISFNSRRERTSWTKA